MLRWNKMLEPQSRVMLPHCCEFKTGIGWKQASKNIMGFKKEKGELTWQIFTSKPARCLHKLLLIWGLILCLYCRPNLLCPCYLCSWTLWIQLNHVEYLCLWSMCTVVFGSWLFLKKEKCNAVTSLCLEPQDLHSWTSFFGVPVMRKYMPCWSSTHTWV